MNKHERKALLRERQEAAEKASEMSRERRIGETPSWRGAGHLRLQLRERPSFESGSIWDIREIEDTLTLYVSRTNPDKAGYLLPGYTELVVEQKELASRVEQLEGIPVVTPLRFRGHAGFDGTSYTLTRSDGFDSVSFSWWEEGPSEWTPLTEAVARFIDYLKQQKPVQ
ncbi:hypothetical protein HPC49_03345 [Pyxidicoccus fallax]|uniref:Uncharacterized protein n=1 Tax=Pyxidicoccus fallax TaxID=394095 RepID=A0A848LB71_9BACT|nr:hypothetical protein [Pyxidicoccus fallax]NMO15754.1 hypothetical protein [Pyxidicoccus fallax]NPC77292.1 hypothetical protein [Pyxidicoccus fallax]